MARGVQSLSCAGPGAASKCAPEPPELCALCRCLRRYRICQRSGRAGDAFRGVWGALREDL
eukprot:12715255-Alexandrium_andersonii.AAC.1